MPSIANALNMSTPGLQSLNSSGVFNGRTLQGTSNQIQVANADGTGGNPTYSLTSTIYVSGISFDSGTDTLQNYVQGTFTPTISNTGTAPTITYLTQVGTYTRIGNRVIVDFQAALSAYTGGSGNTQLSSFPITSNSTSNDDNIGAMQLQNITFGASVLYYTSDLPPNSTVANIQGIRSATTVLSLVSSGPSSSAIFETTIQYQV